MKRKKSNRPNCLAFVTYENKMERKTLNGPN